VDDERQMTSQPPYISRPQAESVLDSLDLALKNPGAYPGLFNVWGVGGVGKSTFLRKVVESHPDAGMAIASFGLTEKIDTPIELMQTLYTLLRQPLDWEPEYESLYRQYSETLVLLKTQPVSGQATVDKEAVQGLIKGATDVFGKVPGVPKEAVDAVGGLLAIADKTKQLLQQHQATKKNLELQKLMQDPLARLTAAFVEALKSQNRPILLLLDTYEKVSSEVDSWLCRSLLGNHADLRDYPVRWVVVGRNALSKTEAWRKLQQDLQMVDERLLMRFDGAQTQAYLNQIGVTEPSRVQQIFQVTKGLPYYLNWIRERQEAGKSIDFSEGNQEIVRLLLQGLNAAQTQVIQIAACCRWFNRGLIQALMEQQQIDFQTAVDGQLNCFEWLTQKTFFVERVQRQFRLDDVARDVFHGALWEDDRARFQQVHCQVADYFWKKSNQEVDPDSPPPERYNNPDWREYRIEFLYHLLFTRRAKSQVQFLTHLLEARYFEQDELVKIPVEAVAAELDDLQQRLLPSVMQQFLLKIRPAVMHGWEVLEESPIDYEENQTKLSLSKADIDQAVQVCLNLKQIETLTGLAKFAALFYKSKRCIEDQQLEWLLKAQTQAEQITTNADLEFSSGLFLWRIGHTLVLLEQHEAALVSYDKAIEIKPDDHTAWLFRGGALASLSQHEAAFISYDKAIEIKPDDHTAWFLRGFTSYDLGQHEAAIASYDKAIEIKPDYYDAWHNRSIVLSELGQHEAAIASYDKAIEIKPDYYDAWHNRGMVLFKLGRYEAAIVSYDKAVKLESNWRTWCIRGVALYDLGLDEIAIDSYDKALEIKPDFAHLWSVRGVSLCRIGQHEEAIASFDKALKLEPDYYQAWSNRGKVLSILGQHEEAVASYDKAIEIKSNDHEVWSDRGAAFYALEQHEAAIASYDKALDLKPDDDDAHYNQACCYALQDNWEAAIASLQRAIGLDASCREEAKTDTDFDGIRDNEQFQALISS
jgi:tetratricopeptide (TPR) repeat protein